MAVGAIVSVGGLALECSSVCGCGVCVRVCCKVNALG